MIIPDARFKNEVSGETWYDFDTVHLRVERSDNPCALHGAAAEHISETDLDDVEPDKYIFNRRDLADLWLFVSAWATSDLFPSPSAGEQAALEEGA